VTHTFDWRAEAIWSRTRQIFVMALLVAGLLTTATRTASAMDIEVVKSPGGIEAWLVEERSVPLIAMRFAFEGGNAQDPEDKPGVANFLSVMLDEGAGDLDAEAYQQRLEDLAIRLNFSDSRDHFSGSLQTLTENRDEAFDMLRLALAKPRFDADAVARMRRQLLARLAFDAKNPQQVAAQAWARTAFPDHPYGRPSRGTPLTVPAIGRDDLEGYRKRVFARSNLKVAVVGAIDAETLGPLLDKVFGALPETADLKPVADVEPVKGGVQTVIEMAVPQSVAVFGLNGIPRKDPDFIPAFVLNHSLGGGGFASRLMEEVREKRGLAYSVYSYLQPNDHGSVFAGGVATQNERVAESLSVIRSELKKLAEEGLTDEDLANAKQYLTGSYALRFDTNSKVAQQLLGIQLDDLGIDYVKTRNEMIEAVTLDDIKRAAERLLTVEDLIVTVVGQPVGLPG